MIERATILAGNGPILPEHLPTQLPVRGKPHQSAAAPIGGPHFQIPEGNPTLRDIEMQYIQADPREAQRQQARRLARAGDQPEDPLQQDQSASAQLIW